jgi:hypothetical protein
MSNASIARTLVKGQGINELEEAAYYQLSATLIDPQDTSAKGARAPLNNGGQVYTVQTAETLPIPDECSCVIATSHLQSAIRNDQPCTSIYFLKNTPTGTKIPPAIETNNILSVKVLDTRLPHDRFQYLMPLSEKLIVKETTPDISRQGTASVMCTTMKSSQVQAFPVSSMANFAPADEWKENLNSAEGVCYINRFTSAFKQDPQRTSYSPGRDRKVKWVTDGIGNETFGKTYKGVKSLAVGSENTIEYYGSQDPETLGISNENLQSRELQINGSQQTMQCCPEYGATFAEPLPIWDTKDLDSMINTPIGQSNVAIFPRDTSHVSIDFSFKMTAGPKYFDFLTGKNYGNLPGLTGMYKNPLVDSILPVSEDYGIDYTMPAECYAGQDHQLLLFRLEALGDNFSDGRDRVVGVSRWCVRYGFSTEVKSNVFFETEGDDNMFDATLSSDGLDIKITAKTLTMNGWQVRSGVGDDPYYITTQGMTPSQFGGDEQILRLRVTVQPVDEVPWTSVKYTAQPWSCYAKGGQCDQLTYVDPNTDGPKGWLSGASGYFLTNTGFNKSTEQIADPNDPRNVVMLEISKNGGACAILGPPTGGVPFKSTKRDNGIRKQYVIDEQSTPSVDNNPCVNRGIVKTRYRWTGLTEANCVKTTSGGFVIATQNFTGNEEGWGSSVGGLVYTGIPTWNVAAGATWGVGDSPSHVYLTYRDPQSVTNYQSWGMAQDIIAYGVVAGDVNTGRITSIKWGGSVQIDTAGNAPVLDFCPNDPFAGRDGKGFTKQPYVVFCIKSGSPKAFSPFPPTKGGLGYDNLVYLSAALGSEPLSCELVDPGFGYTASDAGNSDWSAPPDRPSWMGGVGPITGSTKPTNNCKFSVSNLLFDSNVFGVESNVSNVKLLKSAADDENQRRGMIILNNIQQPTGGLTRTSLRIEYYAAVYGYQRNVNRPLIQPPTNTLIAGNDQYQQALRLLAVQLPTVYANTLMQRLGAGMLTAVDVQSMALSATTAGGWLRNATSKVGNWVRTGYKTGEEAFRNLDPTLIEAAKMALRSKEAQGLKRSAMKQLGIRDTDLSRARQVAGTAWRMGKQQGLFGGTNASLHAFDIGQVAGDVGKVAQAVAPIIPHIMPLLFGGTNAALHGYSAGEDNSLTGTTDLQIQEVDPVYAYTGENFGEARFPAIEKTGDSLVREGTYGLSVSNHRKSKRIYNKHMINGHRVYTDARLMDLKNPSAEVITLLSNYLTANPGLTYITLDSDVKRNIKGQSYEAALASALKGQKGRNVTGMVTDVVRGKAQIGPVLGVTAKAANNSSLEVPAENSGDARGNRVVHSI